MFSSGNHGDDNDDRDDDDVVDDDYNLNYYSQIYSGI